MYKTILLPVAHDAENNLVAPLEITKLLAAEDAQIILVHVMEVLPAYAMGYVSVDILQGTREGFQDEMDAVAKTLPNARAVVLDGHAGRSLADFATEHGVDLIVMASHRPGFGEMFIGSTAAYVMRHVTCAVHVLRDGAS